MPKHVRVVWCCGALNCTPLPLSEHRGDCCRASNSRDHLQLTPRLNCRFTHPPQLVVSRPKAATMSEPSSSYANIPTPSAEEVDSLPSSSAGSSTSASPSEEEEFSDAEREWRESLQQLELLLTMVLVPYLGKYFGRRCAYWGECRHDTRLPRREKSFKAVNLR